MNRCKRELSKKRVEKRYRSYLLERAVRIGADVDDEAIHCFEEYRRKLAKAEYERLVEEIWLREVVDAIIVGFQRRIYDISCGLSLESCLIEPGDNDIRDVCYNLKLLHLDIDALNAEEHFSENIVFENVDRHGQEPVCSEEFRDNEWGDKECRSYFLRRLVDMALVSKEDMDKIMKNMEAEIV